MNNKTNKHRKPIGKNGNDKKNKKNRTKQNVMKIMLRTPAYKQYLKELEKLKDGDMETVKKVFGGDFWTDLGHMAGMGGIWVGANIRKVFTIDWIAHIYYFFKDNFWDPPYMQAFYEVFIKAGQSIGNIVINILDGLGKMWTDIYTYGAKSKWLWVMVTIAGLGVFDWQATVGNLGTGIQGFISTYVNGPFTTNVVNFNFFSFIGSVITFVFSTLGNVLGGIVWTLFSSPIVVSSFVWLTLIGALLWALNAIRLEGIKEDEYLRERLKGKKKEDAEAILAKKEKVVEKEEPPKSTPKKPAKSKKGGAGSLLHKLKNISQSTLEKLKEENPMNFQLAILCGFIKEADEGYIFTEQAGKTLEFLIDSSQEIIKGKDTDNLDDFSIIDRLEALQFVHVAAVHAVARSNEEVKVKTGGGHKGKSIQSTIEHLKKEDVEWIGEKYPEQLASAKRLGLVSDGVITKEAANVLVESQTINGKSLADMPQ
jgi:hypothetical protein